MHPIDRVGAVMIKRGPQRLRIFPGGWGEQRYVDQLDDIATIQTAVPQVDIAWSPTKHLADRTVRDGRFPAIADVPAAAAHRHHPSHRARWREWSSLSVDGCLERPWL